MIALFFFFPVSLRVFQQLVESSPVCRSPLFLASDRSSALKREIDTLEKKMEKQNKQKKEVILNVTSCFLFCLIFLFFCAHFSLSSFV